MKCKIKVTFNNSYTGSHLRCIYIGAKSKSDNEIYLFFASVLCVYITANSDRFCLHVLNKGLETSMWYCFDEQVSQDDRMSTSLCHNYVFWPVFCINTQPGTIDSVDSIEFNSEKLYSSNCSFCSL